MNKKTLVIGASTKNHRYSNMAVRMLQSYNYEVVAIGRKHGLNDNVEIITEKPQLNNIHTVSLYVNSEIQKEYYDYILSLKPKRIIFNPGTQNEELEKLANNQNIETLDACTLVMLRSEEY